MKSTLALILSVTFVAFAAGAIAGEKGYFAEDKEELYGTWVNMEYKSKSAQKIIYKSDGTIEFSRAALNWRARYLITGKWEDTQGNIFYRYHWIDEYGLVAYTLSRISNSGNTLETVRDHEAYPKEIDLKGIFYLKHTREYYTLIER